jgi:mono/diheme cytochrome c family protein
MRKLLSVGVALLAIVGLAAIVVAVSIVRGGFGARAKASRAEAFAAEALRDLATPGAAKARRSPVAATPDVLARGRRHFAEECALCHGNDGRGGELGRSVFPPVPDLRRSLADMSDGEIFHVVEEGIRFSAMPAFGHPGDDGEAREHWEVVAFLRHLPEVTPAEVEEMRRWNPRSPAEGEAPAGRGEPATTPAPSAAHEHGGHHHHDQ